jgi:hypothetical protein
MLDKAWRFVVEGQPHTVGMKISSVSGGGRLSLDGKEIKNWGASLSGLPLTIRFDVQGKPAELKGKGFLSSNPSLFVDRKEVRPS